MNGFGEYQVIPIKNKYISISLAIFFFLAVYIYSSLPWAFSWGPSSNYQNVSVRTTVNVNESFPEITNISCNNGASITLNAGTTKTINCTITIMDYEGGANINRTNITFYYYLNNSVDPNDNNTHYTNASCVNTSDDGLYTVNWTCSLDLLYYANNGTWTANASIWDDMDNSDTFIKNFTINALYALNVTSLIDFGNVPVGDTSTEQQANITNFGNRDINISIYGFGGQNETTYAGLAMVCAQRNITISNERYSITSGAGYAAMTSVQTSYATIAGLKIIQQTDDTLQVINSTYWTLHVNVSTNPFGICNGTVVFAAIAP